MKRKRVRDHFSRICNDKHSDQKEFWNTIRPYISSRKKQTFHNERIVLKDNGGIIREQRKSPRFWQNIFQVLSTLISINCLKVIPDNKSSSILPLHLDKHNSCWSEENYEESSEKQSYWTWSNCSSSNQRICWNSVSAFQLSSKFSFLKGRSAFKLETRWNCPSPQERLYINKD